MQEQIYEAVSLMIIGMVSVTLFLSLMVVLMRVMSTLTQRVSASDSLESTERQANIVEDNSEVISAISAAISQYQKDNTRK